MGPRDFVPSGERHISSELSSPRESASSRSESGPRRNFWDGDALSFPSFFCHLFFSNRNAMQNGAAREINIYATRELWLACFVQNKGTVNNGGKFRAGSVVFVATASPRQISGTNAVFACQFRDSACRCSLGTSAGCLMIAWRPTFPSSFGDVTPDLSEQRKREAAGLEADVAERLWSDATG